MIARQFIIFLLCFHFIALDSTEQGVFVRTSGERDKSNRIHGSPDRITCFSCIGKCKASPLCHCLRVSTKGTCEYFTNKNQPIDFTLDGFVYYAADSVNKSLSTDSLALNKPADQSSVFIGRNIRFTANYAVDGNRNTQVYQSPHMSITSDKKGGEKNPWWQVDLEDEYLIVAVRLLNREGCCEDRMHDFQIRVGHVKLTTKWNAEVFDENSLCVEHPGGGIGSGAEIKLYCQPCPVHGRYVSVQIVRYCVGCKEPMMNILQLAEVDVYGQKLH